MPRIAEPAPGPFARAVADAIADRLASFEPSPMSARELGRLVGMSSNYLSLRFRKEASFTLTDVERIGDTLGFDAAEFLGAIEVEYAGAVVTAFPNVGGAGEAVRDDEPYAASSDASLPDEGDHTP